MRNLRLTRRGRAVAVTALLAAGVAIGAAAPWDRLPWSSERAVCASQDLGYAGGGDCLPLP